MIDPSITNFLLVTLGVWPIESFRQSNLGHLLGCYLFRRYELNGSTKDLNDVVTTIEVSLASMSEEDSIKGEAIINLGSILLTRHCHTGDELNLDRGIRMVAEVIVDISPGNDFRRRGRVLRISPHSHVIL